MSNLLQACMDGRLVDSVSRVKGKGEWSEVEGKGGGVTEEGVGGGWSQGMVST